jgi:hypothetical protein
MQPETQSQTQKYSRTKDLLIVFLGILAFIAICSLVIYEGGNFVIKTYAQIQDKGVSAFFEEEGSVSDGDAHALKAIDNLNERLVPTQYSASSTVSNSDIQYVIFSFDGSRSINMWKESRQFSKDMTAKGKPLHFTYFINPIYLLTKEAAQKTYQPPREKMGDSMIGYADSEQDVKDRVEQINLAYSEGNEIGSHNVGHFNGSKWNHDEWLQESDSFDSIITNVQKNNPDVVIPPWAFGLSEIVGFRAPELGVNNDLYKVLSEKKYLYDSSGLRMPTKYPVKDKDGIWHIGLGIITVKNLQSNFSNTTVSKHVLSMDYNFWMLQSNTKNVAKKGTPLWDSFFGEVKNAYLDYFNNNYDGNHAPVVIGHHFSSWNDGVYWEAEKSFAEDVCGKPKVKCVTFKEYVDYLNSVSK